MEPIVCPQCRKTPVIAQEKNVFVLSCITHPYYIAEGKTLAEAIKHWNTFITFMTKERVIKNMELDGGLDESFCLICQITTISRKVLGVFDTIECLSCNFLKFKGNLEVVL